MDVLFVQSQQKAFRWDCFQGLVTQEAEFEAGHTPLPADLAVLTAGFLPL